MTTVIYVQLPDEIVEIVFPDLIIRNVIYPLTQKPA